MKNAHAHGWANRRGCARHGRRLVLLAVLPVVALLCGGCAIAVSGLAHPVYAPGSPGLIDPCSLLSSDDAERLGLAEQGTPKPAQPQYRIPPSCLWSPENPSAAYDGSLQVFYGTGQSIDEYYSTPAAARMRLGGVTWTKYPSAVGDFICDLAVKLTDTSFVALSSQNLANPANACDLAQQAAPLVAVRLPK